MPFEGTYCKNTINSVFFSHPLTDETIFLEHMTKFDMLKCPVLSHVRNTNRPLEWGVTKHKSTFKRCDVTTAVARHFINRNQYLSRLWFMRSEHIFSSRSKKGQRQFLLNGYFWKVLSGNEILCFMVFLEANLLSPGC